jgi:hypothetical protein
VSCERRSSFSARASGAQIFDLALESFGPLDRSTLEFLQHWYQSQQFVTFTESEPSMEFSDTEAEDDETEPHDPPMKAIFEDEDDEEFDKAAEAPGVAAAKRNTKERKREVGHRYPKRKAKKAAAKRGKR